MPPLAWQKSSYCPEGNSCVHIAATPGKIHLTESADPSGAVLSLSPASFRALLTTLKTEPAPTHEGDDTPVRLRSADTTVTTDRRRWHAFVLGVRDGEFDHFTRAQPCAPSSSTKRR
ncbi:DUF397 domain-containing protein [Streptomyces sp. NBC_00820]|uniref:DUF397 domain-containing protein n=1 Tax=Streptomyces sp. NBC_00820 TaxID=2975842 RepID=UPI002ED2A444|nr:DUF397 domain-containing protein [Streptomyces sp. NBC_00820]